MKSLASLAVTLFAAAVPCIASASVDYSAALSFDRGLPLLRTGSSYGDSQPGILDGHWLTLGQRNAWSQARNQTGYALDTTSGQMAATWGDWTGGPGNHNYGGPMWTLGEVIARAPRLDNNASGHSEIFWSSITADGTIHQPGAQVNSSATWTRNFSLEAFTSFTFTALASIGIVGDGDAPLDRQTWIDVDESRSFSSVVMADAADRVRASLSATIDSIFPGGLGGVITQGISRDGRLSLTVTNNSSSVMTGSLQAGTWVAVSAPIPEPEMVLTMLAGIGAIGVVARRRRPSLAA